MPNLYRADIREYCFVKAVLQHGLLSFSYISKSLTCLCYKLWVQLHLVALLWHWRTFFFLLFHMTSGQGAAKNTALLWTLNKSCCTLSSDMHNRQLACTLFPYNFSVQFGILVLHSFSKKLGLTFMSHFYIFFSFSLLSSHACNTISALAWVLCISGTYLYGGEKNVFSTFRKIKMKFTSNQRGKSVFQENKTMIMSYVLCLMSSADTYPLSSPFWPSFLPMSPTCTPGRDSRVLGSLTCSILVIDLVGLTQCA